MLPHEIGQVETKETSLRCISKLPQRPPHSHCSTAQMLSPPKPTQHLNLIGLVYSLDIQIETVLLNPSRNLALPVAIELGRESQV